MQVQYIFLFTYFFDQVKSLDDVAESVLVIALGLFYTVTNELL